MASAEGQQTRVRAMFLFRKPRAKRLFFKQSAFLMARPLRGGCLLVGSGYDAWTTRAPQKFVLRAKALHETDLSSKEAPRRSSDLCVDGRTPWPAQHSAVRLARVARGGRSTSCADATGCVEASMNFVVGAALHSFARLQAESHPLRRLRVAKRCRCGALRMCLGLGKHSAEVVRVEALSLWRCANLDPPKVLKLRL